MISNLQNIIQFSRVKCSWLRLLEFISFQLFFHWGSVGYFIHLKTNWQRLALAEGSNCARSESHLNFCYKPHSESLRGALEKSLEENASDKTLSQLCSSVKFLPAFNCFREILGIPLALYRGVSSHCAGPILQSHFYYAEV